ncbi:MAG: indole-3-glycerol phosphate synthase, partial [Gemmatimonadetes bacterium 21-71-4]
MEVDELRNYVQIANYVGLDALVEAHDADEAKLAVEVGARIIGVNQRDLRTFVVDTRRAAEVADLL